MTIRFQVKNVWSYTSTPMPSYHDAQLSTGATLLLPQDCISAVIDDGKSGSERGTGGRSGACRGNSDFSTWFASSSSRRILNDAL